MGDNSTPRKRFIGLQAMRFVMGFVYMAYFLAVVNVISNVSGWLVLYGYVHNITDPLAIVVIGGGCITVVGGCWLIGYIGQKVGMLQEIGSQQTELLNAPILREITKLRSEIAELKASIRNSEEQLTWEVE